MNSGLDLVDSWVVEALSWRLAGVSVDDVLSLLKVVHELVQLDKVKPVLVDVDGLSVVVVLGSEVDAHYGVVDGVLALHDDFVLVWLVVQSLDGGVYVDVLALLLLLLVLSLNVVQVNQEIVEVGYQAADVDLLDLDTWQNNVVVLVGW